VLAQQPDFLLISKKDFQNSASSVRFMYMYMKAINCARAVRQLCEQADTIRLSVKEEIGEYSMTLPIETSVCIVRRVGYWLGGCCFSI
jgi:hypothetical protein